jgi:predicted nucleic acid-binding protein
VRFVDTNVLPYAISRDSQEQEKAARANEILAIATRRRFAISYWDAAIIEAGRRLACRVVLSEDLNDGQDYGGVTVENPFRDC